MRYDVFLVSCLADRDFARLVARRLRALRFRVAFNANQADELFSARDARDAAASGTVLVLWSQVALTSDWVRAAASVGHSRPGTLLQAVIDKTTPYDPFSEDPRFSLEGMSARRTPEGFVLLVEELARRCGRTGLRHWMGLSLRDEAGRSAWLAAHPADPLAEEARKKRERDLGLKPAPAREAIGAAVLAAAALKAGRTGPAAVPDRVAEPVSSLAAILSVSTAIAAMLVLAWIFRSDTALRDETLRSAGANAIAGYPACPAGTIPRSLLTVLEHGQIIDDTAPATVTPEAEGEAPGRQ